MHKVLVLTVVLGVLAVVGSAQAASWQVAAGEQTRPPAGTPKGATLNAFFPAKLTINAGDSVTFSSVTFHTVTYPGGKPLPALFLPDPGKGTYDGLNDAAGEPFYFDPLPKLIYNGAAFAPAGGKSIVAGVTTSSGVLSPPGPKAPPAKATFTFPKAGVFQFFCTVHPGMKATVAVKAAGTPVPLSAAQVTSKALTDTSAAWAKAKALAAAPVPKNTVYVGVGGSTTILGFSPRVLTVKAGTTVTFLNHSPSEPHNVTFGPKKYLLSFSKTTDLFPGGPGSKNQVTPLFPYGTEPKGGYTFDGSNHGNGFFSTPLTTGSPLVPLPHAAKVTFSTAGTYKYICFLHGADMAGTVVVTP
jgi:plastocyanin